VGKPEERDFLRDLGVDGRVISRWILKEQDWRLWTDLSGMG
jgi:hypothetical protein